MSGTHKLAISAVIIEEDFGVDSPGGSFKIESDVVVRECLLHGEE